MNKSNIVVGGLAVLALLGVVFLYFRSSEGITAGAIPSGPSHYQGETFMGGIQVGQRGTFQTLLLSGTCNLSTGMASFAASTTGQFVCSVPGVAAGDLVLADLPVGAGTNGNGPGSIGAGFSVASAYATTSNVIGVTLQNFTGAATSSYIQATTTVEYRVIR